MKVTHSNPRRDTCLRSLNHPDHAFASLGGAAGARFNAMGMEMGFRRGTTLFSEGERPRCIFIVRSGRIKLSTTSRKGRMIILTIAERGHVLGLRAMLTASELQVSAEALEPCRVTTIPVADFLRFLRDFPDAALRATRCILEEYKVVFDNIRRLALPTTAAGRLATLLLDWVKRRSQRGVAEPRLAMMLTHEEIGAMAGTSRETVSRVLHRFQRKRVISVKGLSLTVLRAEALKQIAAGQRAG